MTSRPNIILVILDGLPHGRLGAAGYVPGLTPNLDRLAQRGWTCWQHFCTGCPTQIALPAIFTSSLPLDHGGYNDGIVGRPHSFVENLQEAGYHTAGIATVSWFSQRFGYHRGFDTLIDLVDFVGWWQALHISTLRDLVWRWSGGEIDETDAVAELQTVFVPILEDGLRILALQDRIGAVEGWRSRRDWRARIESELRLLSKEPRALLRRLHELQGRGYMGFGHARVDDALKATMARNHRWEKRLNKYVVLKGRRRVHQAAEIDRHLADLLRQRPQKPLFLMLHYFDLHESRTFLPNLRGQKLLDLPRDLTAALSGRNEYHLGGLAFDIGLSHLDRQVGRLMKQLEQAGLADNTYLIFTADHGSETQNPQRRVGAELPLMFFDEFLRVPNIVVGPDIDPRRIDALTSHLDLGPTICDLAGLTPPPAFRGLSLAQRRNRPEEQVLSENTGRGSCDLVNKTIYIGARTPTMKVVYEAEAETVREREVYDIEKDHRELNNVQGDDWGQAERQRLMAIANRRVRELRSGARRSTASDGK